MNLFAIGICAFVLLSFNAISQQPPLITEKARQAFHKIPSKSRVNSEELRRLFRYDINDSIQLRLSPDIFLEGRITAKQIKLSGAVLINLLADNYPGILFNFSMVPQNNGHQKISGRVIHKNLEEVMILKEENGEYFFEKLKRERLLPEHGADR